MNTPFGCFSFSCVSCKTTPNNKRIIGHTKRLRKQGYSCNPVMQNHLCLSELGIMIYSVSYMVTFRPFVAQVSSQMRLTSSHCNTVRVVQQRNFSMSVNSAAVLRLTGRGAGVVAGAPRGRSSSRGRGKYSQPQSHFPSHLLPQT